MHAGHGTEGLETERVISTSAASRVHRRRENSSGASSAACGSPAQYRVELRQAFGRHPKLALAPSRRIGYGNPCCAPLPRKLGEKAWPLGIARALGWRDEGETQQRIVHFVRARRFGPCLLAHALDRRDVELPKGRCRCLVQPSPTHHGLRAALLERRIVEIGVRPRGQDLERKRRWRCQVAGDHLDAPALDASQQPLETFDVHCFVQAIVHRLTHERMIRNFAVPHEVLRARDLVREYGRDQVFGAHPLQRRRPSCRRENAARERIPRSSATARQTLEHRASPGSAARAPGRMQIAGDRRSSKL